MNTVIYTPDLEPITVINLSREQLDSAEKNGGIKLVIKTGENDSKYENKSCIIFCKRIKLDEGTEKTLYITHDEEIALVMKPDWLPGQVYTFNSQRKMIDKLINTITELKKKFLNGP